MSSPGGMQGVPTALGFIGSQDDVLGTPGLDFDPMAQDPMADPSSAYDVPPLSFDRSQIPKWVQSAKDQLAKSFNTNSLLDNIFSGPNAGLTLDQIEQAEMQANLMGAVDKDLSEGLLGSEERFAESMQKLQALMGNTPQIPGEAPLGQPDPAASIVSGIVAALTPEHAFDIAAVPYQIEQRKQAEENERLMLEYKNQMLQQEAAIAAQEIEVKLEEARLGWAQKKADAAAARAEALRKSEADSSLKNQAQQAALRDDMARSNVRIPDSMVDEYVKFAVKNGEDGERALERARSWQRDKDSELADKRAADIIQEARMAYQFLDLTKPENAQQVADEAIAAINTITSVYKNADPATLSSIADLITKRFTAMAGPSKSMVMHATAQENARLRFEAQQELAWTQFNHGWNMDMLDASEKAERLAIFKERWGKEKKQMDQTLLNSQQTYDTAKSGMASKDFSAAAKAGVTGWETLRKEHNARIELMATLEAERAGLVARGDDKETWARIVGIDAQLEGFKLANANAFRIRDEMFARIGGIALKATAGMTAQKKEAWWAAHQITPEMIEAGMR